MPDIETKLLWKLKTRGNFALETKENEGFVTKIERYAIHDGLGIRTLVFFKGCRLKCLWCFNPETQAPYPQMAYFENKCIGCRRCVDLCPYAAIEVGEEGGLHANWKVCKENCYGKREIFKCTEKCYSQARENVGKKMSVEDIMDEILKDRSYYERTGGGVTVSGGEPLAQPKFLLSLLIQCKEKNIHTAIETSGCADWEDLCEAIDLLDFIFYDLKVIDSTQHERFTGRPNAEILNNAIRMSVKAYQKKIPVTIRIPIVPGYTDTKKNVSGIARFIVKKLKKVERIELLAYRRLGVQKYDSIGLNYGLKNLKPPIKDKMRDLEKLVKAEGLKITHV